MLLPTLCLFSLLLSSAQSAEVTTTNPETDNVDDIWSTPNASTTTTSSPTQRKLQPTQPSSQSQQIEQSIALNASVSFENSDKVSPKSSSSFKPSPQLETFYEYNKFPVPPAHPEAKQHAVTSWNLEEFPLQQQWPPLKEVPHSTTEPSYWTARVKFPESPVLTDKDRPYQFYNEKSAADGKSFSSSGGGAKKANWDKFETRPAVMHKNQFDFSAPVKIPSGLNAHHKTHLSSLFDYSAEKHQPHEMSHHDGNPWKKIIKLLTAFIPIGLLISALTPTVITVSTINGTQSRLRSEDGSNHHYANSLSYLSKLNSNGCEDRILCELLLTATASKNAEQHVKNLLDIFAKGGKAVERAEDMKKVFDGVKRQDCTSIICKSIPQNT